MVKSNTVTVTVAAAFTVVVTPIPATGVVGESITFDASVYGGSAPYSYHWDFGDGSSGSGATTATHSFSAAKVYTVTCEVTDAAGSAESGSAQISIGGAGSAGAVLLLYYFDYLDTFIRVWAVYIDRQPGPYLGGAKWSGGTPDATGTFSPISETFAGLASGAHELYLVFSVPDSGYGAYTAEGTINGASVALTDITENHPGVASFTV